MTPSQSKLCGECEGTGRTSNHVTGEVECGACEGTGREAPSQSTDDLVKPQFLYMDIGPEHPVHKYYAATIERLQRELSELQQYGVVVPVNPTAAIRSAMSEAYDRRLPFIDRWDRVYNAALNAAICAARKEASKPVPDETLSAARSEGEQK